MLVGLSFLGGEAVILLGDEDWSDACAPRCAASATSSGSLRGGRYEGHTSTGKGARTLMVSDR